MNKSKITIRPATAADAEAVLSVHYDAVHNIASADYSEDIIEHWSRPVDQEQITHFLKNPDNGIRLIAEIDGKIVGFSVLVPQKNELQACYVSSDAIRKGVGRELVQEIERIAKEKNLDYLQLDSSLTAEKFYLACGYQIIKHGTHTMTNGKVMSCVVMRKNLVE